MGAFVVLTLSCESEAAGFQEHEPLRYSGAYGLHDRILVFTCKLGEGLTTAFAIRNKPHEDMNPNRLSHILC